METTTARARANLALPLQSQLLERAQRLTRNPADARDLVQDTIERVMRSSRAPSTDTEFGYWIRCVMNHLWIDRVRARKWRHHVVYFDHTPPSESVRTAPQATPAVEDWRDLTLSDVRRALENVPEPFRAAFVGHAIERRSYCELAGRLGIRPATVGTRVLRARRLLRTILEEEISRSRSPQRRD